MIALYSVLYLVLCLVLQVLVFNHLHLFGGVVFIYLIPLLKMPVGTNRSLQILAGFLSGLCLDIFSNTLGLHALVCTTVMWLRLPILHMFVIADEVKNTVPSVDRLGLPVFVRYILTIISTHSVLLYVIESLSLFNLVPLLVKIIVTIALTIAFTLAIELATSSKK